MLTEHIFVIWSGIRIKSEVSRMKTSLDPPAVFLLNVSRRFLCCSYFLFHAFSM